MSGKGGSVAGSAPSGGDGGDGAGTGKVAAAGVAAAAGWAGFFAVSLSTVFFAAARFFLRFSIASDDAVTAILPAE